MAKLKLRIALDRYDRHMPFFDGTVPLPENVELETLQVGQSGTYRDGTDRHGRMLSGNEFDICEFSMSTYLLARERELPIIGVPVFPRRLFSPSQIFVRDDSSLETVADLAGKRVGIGSFQTTFSVLAKGDLKFEYGVPWESIRWCVTDREKLPITLKPGVVVEALGEKGALGTMLNDGRIDAVIVPHPLNTFASGATPLRRLFRDTRAEELRYFRKYGYYPIMHIIVLRQDLARQEPWLPRALMGWFERAKDIATGYYEDPNWSLMPWGRHCFEDSRAIFGSDAWPSGVAANRANLERFVGYSMDQGLLSRPLPVESLFTDEVRST